MKVRSWVVYPLMCLLLLVAGPASAVLPEEPSLAVVAQFTARLQEGRFETAHLMFSPAIRPLLPAQQLAGLWLSLPGQMGELLQLEEPYLVSSDGRLIVRQPAHFAGADIDLQFAVDAEQLITEFLLVPHVPRASFAASKTVPYADPRSFSETELQFGLPDYPLGGTLTLPHGEGPFPAVVLVHGSGPNDRDETVGGVSKPFRDLAWGLATRGIAVFRYDKRTYVYGQNMAFEDVTVENEVIADAVLAMQLVAGRPKVDAARVFLLGHSLGGTLAPHIASQVADVAGIISMAGTPRPLYDLLPLQVAYLSGLDGEISAEEQAEIDTIAAEVAQIRRGDIPDEGVLLGAPAPYWRGLRERQPVAEAARLQIPLLFLQGERDYQVTLSDFALWQEGLLSRADFVTYPDLNHLFISGTGPSTPQEYMQPGHVAEQVVDDVASWILQDR